MKIGLIEVLRRGKQRVVKNRSFEALSRIDVDSQLQCLRCVSLIISLHLRCYLYNGFIISTYLTGWLWKLFLKGWPQYLDFNKCIYLIKKINNCLICAKKYSIYCYYNSVNGYYKILDLTRRESEANYKVIHT